MRLVRRYAGGLLALTLAVTACTEDATSEPPRESSTADAEAAASPTRLARVTLTCEDSITANPTGGRGDRLIMVDDITFSHFVVGPDDKAAPYAESFDVGDDGRNLWKAPVYLSAGTAPVTVELLNPEVGRLAWVPYGVWTSFGDITEFEATTVTLTGCPDRGAGYLGGLLLNQPTGCMSLRVSRDDWPLTGLQVPIGQADC